jgi:hypothetical protein
VYAWHRACPGKHRIKILCIENEYCTACAEGLIFLVAGRFARFLIVQQSDDADEIGVCAQEYQPRRPDCRIVAPGVARCANNIVINDLQPLRVPIKRQQRVDVATMLVRRKSIGTRSSSLTGSA